MSRLIVVVALAVLASFTGAAVASEREHVDSPRIVPWTQIGAARLLDKTTVVDRTYGPPLKIDDISRYIQGGTRWHGHRVVDRTYPLRGGTLWLRTVDGIIRGLGTTSPRYVTPDGIRVGSKIPRGPCHKDSYGSCTYRWRGFEYEGDCVGGWRKVTRRLDVLLSTRRGHVVEIEFGDPDALLICF